MSAKKSTGPVTRLGKAQSSKNALVHGATSTQLLNDQEQVRFNTLLSELSESYPTTNPLVRLQLERIARLNIQLERIQNAIDAQFIMSRTQANIYQKLASSLGLNIVETSIAFKFANGNFDFSKMTSPERQAVEEELNDIPPHRKPKTAQEFIEFAPQFCHYLFSTATGRRMNVEEFIGESLNPHSSNVNASMPSDLVTRLRNAREGTAQGKAMPGTLESAILATDLEQLKRMASRCSQETATTSSLKRMAEEFQRLLPIEREATTPNLDQLDRLMRYQTTIQRQLSTSIGELLELNKYSRSEQ